MNSATIAALSAGIPTILAAITALIVALKSNGTANSASQTVTSHIMTPHGIVADRIAPVETGVPIMSESEIAPNAPEEVPEEVASEVAPDQVPNTPIDGLALMGLRAPVVDSAYGEPVPAADVPEGAPVPVAPPAGLPAPTQKDAVLAALESLVEAVKNL